MPFNRAQWSWVYRTDKLIQLAAHDHVRMFEIKMSQGAKPGKGGILSVGAVTLALALALSIPTDLEYWWTIQSIAFGVVLYTLLIQVPSIGWLLRRSG